MYHSFSLRFTILFSALLLGCVASAGESSFEQRSKADTDVQVDSVEVIVGDEPGKGTERKESNVIRVEAYAFTSTGAGQAIQLMINNLAYKNCPVELSLLISSNLEGVTKAIQAETGSSAEGNKASAKLTEIQFLNLSIDADAFPDFQAGQTPKFSITVEVFGPSELQGIQGQQSSMTEVGNCQPCTRSCANCRSLQQAED